MKNFRRPGTRVWKKKLGAKDSAIPIRLHVVHGPHGSGKSTLAEGFEYVATGDSSRLGPPGATRGRESEDSRFDPLIYRTGADRPSPAHGIIAGATGPHAARACSVPPTPKDSAPLKIPGGALRLDQRLVDNLAALGSHTRARVWLETFFAEEDAQIRARKQANDRLNQAIRQIEGSESMVNIEERNTALLDLIGKLAGGATLSFREILHATFRPGSRLPVEASVMGSLGLSLPSLLSASVSIDERKGESDWQSDTFEKQILELLKTDTEALALWSATASSKVEHVLHKLEKVGFAKSRAQAASEIAEGPDYDTTFNHYLRNVALQDLLQKAHVIAQTVEHVTTMDTGLHEPRLAQIKPEMTAAEITVHLDQVKTAAAETLKARLTVLSQSSSRKASETSPELDQHEIEPLLDAIKANTFSPLVKPEDAHRLRELIEAQEPGNVGVLEVGQVGWTRPLLDILQQRRLVMETFGVTLLRRGSQSKAPGSRLTERAKAVEGLVDGLVGLSRLEQYSAERFSDVARQENLIPALEELLALLTPARWAYPPLSAAINEDQFDLKSHGFDVAQVLNTAELNTLSLAIYLLCAPRGKNPYRVIFLDDPFQNMDELTVATAARAIARLLRVWSGKSTLLNEWEIVLLLHGEENSQRVLADAPTAYYELPWLPPLGARPEKMTDDDVKSLPGTENAELLFPTVFWSKQNSPIKSAVAGSICIRRGFPLSLPVSYVRFSIFRSHRHRRRSRRLRLRLPRGPTRPQGRLG
ncbi:MAG: AAA family ATPase [Candidatus Synoicihabitans palmerolidicus]|nr:AAA family ATPase [Candidatus Synoicihabitans palmerolidicus]